MPDVMVVSATVTCILSGKMDLQTAIAKVPGMAYDEGMGAGVQKRKDPTCTIVAFSHGELIVSGPQLPDTLLGVAEATVYLLDDKLKIVETKVENVVAEAIVSTTIDLKAAAEAFGLDPPDPARPDPRLEVTFPEMGATVAIFASGKLVLNGVKGEEDVNKVIMTVVDNLGLELE